MSESYTCKQCGKQTEVKYAYSINRKRYPGLCKECANKQIDRTNKTRPEAKDWTAIYNNPLQTADTLKEARDQGLMYYKNECRVHGLMPYATLDQTCRKCTKEQAAARNKQNPTFNRPRVIRLSAARRARQKNIEFDLTLEFIRENIPDLCPALGIKLSYDIDRDTSPSLDRFDPTKGYTVDNVVIISDRANRIKSDGSADEHLKIAVWMLKKQGLSEEDIINQLKRILI